MALWCLCLMVSWWVRLNIYYVNSLVVVVVVVELSQKVSLRYRIAHLELGQ